MQIYEHLFGDVSKIYFYSTRGQHQNSFIVAFYLLPNNLISISVMKIQF